MFARHTPLIVSLAILAACSDKAPSPLAPEHLPITPVHAEFVGTVVLANADLTPAYLQTGEGLISLMGNDASLLTHVAGAQVSVRGIRTTDGIAVESFLVLAVKGREVLDGYVEVTDAAVRLRLLDGTIYALDDAPPALTARNGARVWVTRNDGAAFEFGIIADNR